LEVLEHFSEANQRKRLLEMVDLLEDNGRIIVSVPLEVGLPSFIKNTIRFLIKQNKGDATFKNIIKSLFGIPIERQQDGYIYTHIGFNHNKLETIFSECQFQIIKKEYSPFKYLYNIVNSQVFYTLKKT
jgi:hypothetical protein